MRLGSWLTPSEAEGKWRDLKAESRQTAARSAELRQESEEIRSQSLELFRRAEEVLARTRRLLTEAQLPDGKTTPAVPDSSPETVA